MKASNAWLGAALVLKISLALFFVRFFGQDAIPGFVGVVSNDTASYLEPVDQYVDSGDARSLFGFRMLGYGLPYLGLRAFFPKAIAMNGLIALQTVVAAVALYLLGRTVEHITRSDRAFPWTFLAYFLTPIVSFYDVVALTESFAASALIVSLYALICRSGPRFVLVAGACAAFGVFLKPTFLPVLALLAAYGAWSRSLTPWQRGLPMFFLCLAPFALADSLWIAGRYWSGARQDLALQPSMHPLFEDPARHTRAMVAFLRSQGEDWQNPTEFYAGTFPPCGVPTSRFGCDDVSRLQSRALATQSDIVTSKPGVDEAWAALENRAISNELQAFADSVKREKPLQYFVVAPVRYLARLVADTSTRRMFGEYSTMNPRWRPVRLAVDGLWWGMQVLFAISLVRLLTTSKRSWPLMLIASIVVYFYVIYAMVFGMSDVRYLLPVAPLLTAVVVCSLALAPGSPETAPAAPAMIQRIRTLARLFSWQNLLQMRISGHVKYAADRTYVRHGVALREFRWTVPQDGLERVGDSLRFRFPVEGVERAFSLRADSSDVEVFLQVIRDQEYLEATRLVGPLSAPRIVDAGANIGLTTLFFKSVYPDAHVIAMEPEPHNFRALGETIERNRLENVHPVQAALWTGDGFLAPDRTFRDGKAWSFAVKPPEAGEAAQIAAITLDTLLERHGWDRVDLLKIDIEGAEAHLVRHRATLESMTRRAAFVCMEVHGEVISYEEVRRAFDSFGMRCATSGETLIAWRSGSV